MNASPTLTQRLVLILFPFAFGYYLSYLVRVVNAVLAPDLTKELALSSDTLGLLTAIYFITFAATQIPLGILLDRYGPRKIEAGLLLFAAVGAAVFAVGDSVVTLIIGRGLIGFGVSACLMAGFKAFTQWFKPQRLPMINGLIMAAGGLGALTATAPVQYALGFTDWRGIFTILSVLMALCALLIFTLVPDHPDTARPNTANKASLGEQFKGIKVIFTDSFFWSIAPLTMLSQATFISIQSLWAGPWLRDIGGLSRVEAADTLFLIASAMIAGFLTLGTLAERLSRRGIPPIKVSTLGMMIFITIQGVIILEPASNWIVPIWIAFGFFGTTGIVQYAVLSQHYPKQLSGRVNTALNLLVFIAAFTIQWLIGKIIDHWPQLDQGHYAPEGYQTAFTVTFTLQIMALTWLIYAYRKFNANHVSTSH
ncbi:MAG: MFS transporter [Chromatiales bacterium]|nr:MFS transporter [Chromatiales bacterium]